MAMTDAVAVMRGVPFSPSGLPSPIWPVQAVARIRTRRRRVGELGAIMSPPHAADVPRRSAGKTPLFPSASASARAVRAGACATARPPAGTGFYLMKRMTPAVVLDGRHVARRIALYDDRSRLERRRGSCCDGLELVHVTFLRLPAREDDGVTTAAAHVGDEEQACGHDPQRPAAHHQWERRVSPTELLAPRQLERAQRYAEFVFHGDAEWFPLRESRDQIAEA